MEIPITDTKIIIGNDIVIEIKNENSLEYLDLFTKIIKNKKFHIITDRNLLEYLHPMYYKGEDLIKAD